MLELSEFYEEPNRIPGINSDIYSFDIFALTLSDIKKGEFAQHYHFVCKLCKDIPIIKFIRRNRIQYKCKCKECKDSPKELSIKDIYDYIQYTEQIGIEANELKCKEHENEKYVYYCENCKKNLCNKCIENCFEHEKKIKPLTLDRNTYEKSQYIIDIINKEKEKFQNSINSGKSNFNLDDDNIKGYKLIIDKDDNVDIKRVYLEENKNNIFNDSKKLKSDNNIPPLELNNISCINNDEESEIINNINEINDDDMSEQEYIINLFSIIIDDYKNYPNFNLTETISNIGKYASLIFDDYNEIILEYEFEKENVKYNKIELFGEIFVNNNKDNCFLVINEKLIDLDRFIYLSEIYNNLYKISFPIKLEVRLIEQKYKKMTNMSFMFYGIKTLKSSSNFIKFNAKNITKMSYMFYNCSSISELPDISNFDTSNVTDMSYMLYNCSSLNKLPDISKFNTKNVIDMSYMFYNCSSIKELPDISEWNMEKIRDISSMFCNCESLLSLPDNISNWNLRNVENMNNLFKNCKLLKDISYILK